MIKSVLTLPFRFWKLGVVSVQVAAVGKPELQLTEMVPVKMPVGTSVAVYCAGTPAATVAADGASLRLKSFTVTVALAAEGNQRRSPSHCWSRKQDWFGE
jgi:hypothetical protein